MEGNKKKKEENYRGRGGFLYLSILVEFGEKTRSQRSSTVNFHLPSSPLPTQVDISKIQRYRCSVELIAMNLGKQALGGSRARALARSGSGSGGPHRAERRGRKDGWFENTICNSVMSMQASNSAWCYQYRQAIRPLNYGVMTWPDFNGGFVQALGDLGLHNNPLELSYVPDPLLSLMEAFESFMRGNNLNQRSGFMEALSGLMAQRRSSNRWLPARAARYGGFEALFHGGNGGLNELIEQLLVND